MGEQPCPDSCPLPSDDFVTSFFVGFSNDSQTWAMYTNGYEEMVGNSPQHRSHRLAQVGCCSEACLSPDLPRERG